MTKATLLPKRWTHRAVAIAALVLLPASLSAQINVLTVDCTPMVSPGGSSFGPQNTMGMALDLVDPANTLFNITEVTPAGFQAMTAAQLAAFDLIAVNNHPGRLNCGAGGVGLGATWQNVIGVNSGGRVLLTSHDAPRFHVLAPPNATQMSSVCPGCEPFGSYNFIRDAALWAGGGSQTGLLIFNDAPPFNGGNGWNNPELTLPAAWGISDIADPQAIADGGYTDILPAFAGHPVYVNVNDNRLAPNSISSFAANIGDMSFHSIFKTYNNTIFTETEVMVNSGVVDVGGTGCCSGVAMTIPNGHAITILRDEGGPVPATESSWGRVKSIYR